MEIKTPNLEVIRQQFWPYTAANGITYRVATSSEVRNVINNHYSKVFPKQGEAERFLATPERLKKMQPMISLYEQGPIESFLFYDSKGKAIGWHVGEAEDAITYYMRNTGILPEEQNKGVYQAFLPQLQAYLSAVGFERITSQHQPTNRRILILKLKDGFDIAGMELTERWGPLVKLVKLLAQDRREAFYLQYGMRGHLPRST